MLTTLRRSLSLFAILAVAAAPSVSAQASYFEGFDAVGSVSPGEFGPSGLIAAGWEFRNQSLPQGFGTWQSMFSIWSPHQGAGALMVRADSTTTGGTLSTWALLPPVPNQIAGDELRLYFRGVQSPDDHYELRYSPTGGTSTGSLFNQVGDFTVLLADVHDLPINESWNLVSTPLPGSGRVAIRFYRGTVGFSDSSNALALDSLSVGPPPPPPCNVPPIPNAGETVTWTAAGGPWRICLDTVVPVGGTVVVEPGTRIDVDADRTLRVDGTLLSQGQPFAPIRWVGAAQSSLVEIGPTGRADLHDSLVECHVLPLLTARVDARSTTFSGFGELGGFIGNNQNRRVVMTIDQCVFDGANLQHFSSMTRLTRTDFVGGAHCWLDGYTYIDDVLVDGARLELASLYGQPTLVDGVTVLNNAGGPGLKLSGGSNFLIGPDTVIQNNQVTVEFGPLNAGLLPGSALPTTGNTNDHVLSTLSLSGYGRVDWAPTGIPYVVRQFLANGVAFSGVTLHPGSHVQIQGGFLLGEPRAEGLPENPILIECFDPADPFAAVQGFGEIPRLEYVIIDGGAIGVQPNQGRYQLDNCVIRNCELGASTGSFGTTIRARSTVFENNDAALSSPLTAFASGINDLDGRTNPNRFEGNLVAISNCGDTDFDARSNWWGHASGPAHPDQNPGGLGDAVGCTFSSLVDVSGWETSPPDASNHPPVVRMVEPARVPLLPGDELIVRWTVSDDDTVVSQEVRLHEFQDSSDYTVVASGLAGDVDTIAFTVPPLFNNSNADPYLKVFAVDSTGKEGWDEVPLPLTDDATLPNVLTIDTDLSQPFMIGDEIVVEYSFVGTPTGSNSISSYLVYDSQRHIRSIGALNSIHLPDISTDTARIAVVQLGNGTLQKWTFSEPFTVRPHADIGDAPPTVALLSPVDNGSYPEGGTIPVRWSASDDEGLRSFDIHLSTDDGRTWHPLVEGLSGSTRDWLWRLPTTFTHDGLRLRVLARDHRFQCSSDGADATFVVHGTTGESFCFGDGGDQLGCTDCPCANQVPLGSRRGCLNSTGTGGRLEGLGVASASQDTLRFHLFDAPPGTFAVLVSGANLLPANGLCPPGSGIITSQFDGLRCVGGTFRRHGTRPIAGDGSVGLTTNGWGPPDGPAVGLLAHSGVVAGETRNFQVVYRDSDAAICMRGLNTTQAVSVTALP